MSDSSTQFQTALVQHLVLALQLEANGKSVTINSGHIERFNFSLQPYGYTCAIQFSAYGDDVDPLFNAPEVTKATLTFKCVDPHSYEDKGAPLLEIKGIVTEKCFKRLPFEHDNKPVRYYEITLHDHAKATWEQHFPIGIYVDHSMKDIIEKQSNPEITIKFDWNTLEAKHPITAFSLPHKDGFAEDQQVSFYSFLFWYLQQENGILTYDYKSHGYSIAGKKNKAAGKPLEIFEWWVDPPVCFYPRISRYNTKKLKHTFDSVDSEDKDNPNAFKATRHDSINEENYRCFPEQAHEKIQSTLTPEKNVLEVEFIKMDGQFPFDKLVPGSGVQFKGHKEGTWSSEACYKDKTFQIRSFYVQCDKIALTEVLPKPIQTFRLQTKLVLEEDDETFVARPYFIPPSYPFVMQGTVFSDVGEKEQSTYKILESEKAPQGQYLIDIPLVEDKKQLVVPFTPDLMSGQFYYPFTKGQRVELSLYFHTAKILRLSDWQPLARLPLGVQGCQTVWASNGENKYTVMRHEFEDGKNPLFTIKQSSSETKTQTIEFKEDIIQVLVDEKDKKTLSISLNQKSGFTLSLEDKSAGTTQQIVFDGKTMTHTCKGSGGTSVIVQKPEAISFKCKKFNIECDEVNLNAKDIISLAGKNKVGISTKLADFAASKVNLGG